MAFERFRLDLRGDAYLAGPNNAGKSTLITAIRVGAQMLRIATRRNPTETFMNSREQVLGYSFTNAQVGLDGANLRHIPGPRIDRGSDRGGKTVPFGTAND